MHAQEDPHAHPLPALAPGHRLRACPGVRRARRRRTGGRSPRLRCGGQCRAFAPWRDGRGSVFDLLHEDVEWTVAGTSPVSGVYRSRAQFLEQAVAPIGARLATPIVPTVEQVLAQDNMVVVVWSGQATTRDGGTYRNRYAWHMQLREGRIVRVVAFLDTWALAELLR